MGLGFWLKWLKKWISQFLNTKESLYISGQCMVDFRTNKKFLFFKKHQEAGGPMYKVFGEVGRTVLKNYTTYSSIWIYIQQKIN
jgi:hypothetical protein